MAAHHYKVWTWGRPVGQGATAPVYMGVAAVAKMATNDFPFIVANEMICNHLARSLFLPCPPGVTIEHETDQYFVSLDFNIAGGSLPPANPRAIVQFDPRLAWGVILFDLWVLNGDRHRENLSFDTATSRLTIFDHSHALLGAKGDATSNLEVRRTKISADNHCLAACIPTSDGAENWCRRIASVPDWFIEEVVQSASSLGLPEESVGSCIEILKDRRTRLPEILDRTRSSFPNVVNWS